MIIETKVRKIGNSLGIVLLKEALPLLHVEERAMLYLTPSTEDALRVTPERVGFAEKSKLADCLMQRYRNAFRELAK